MPDWLPEIRKRLAGAGLDPAREAEIAQELAQHLEDRYAEMRALGACDDTARDAALAELNEDAPMRRELSRIETRESTGPPAGDPGRPFFPAGLWQDVRYAARMLRRNPGFTALAVATLAIGVGATTIVYAIVDNMLLRPVPYAHVDRLVRIFERQPDQPDRLVSASYPNLQDWQARSRSFEAIGVYRSRSLTLLEGDPERVTAGTVTAGFLAAAGAQPTLGRAFTEADTAAGAPRVVILSHGAWLRRFGGDRGVIGRPLRTVDGPYEIAGVLAPITMFGGSLDFWMPMELSTATRALRDLRGMFALGRLRSDVTLDQARADMDGIAAALAQEHPENRGWGVTLMPMQEWTVRGLRQPLFIFLAAVACILLITCANVAGLLVARGAGRSSELAIRSSLGASRARLVRQLVTESVVLALAGGGLGALLAWTTIGTLVPLFPVSLPAAWIAVDVRVIVIAIAASVLTGVAFGIIPALGLSRSDTSRALKDSGRSTSRWGRRVGSGLIVLEVALSLVLLTGAGLMVRTLMTLYAIDPGIDVDRLVALRATPLLSRDAAPQRAPEFYRQLVERVRAMPGVHAAAAIDTPPFGGSTVFAMALSDVDGAPAVGVSPRAVTPGYFEVMGIELAAGRDFSSADAATSGKVVIVNQTAASQLWPGQNPVGRQLRFQVRDSASEPYEVIGVADDARHDGLDHEVLAELYQPFTQRRAAAMTVVARAADPDAVGRQFKAVAAGLPERALIRPSQTFAAMVHGTVEQRRNRTVLLAVLATLAVLLAAVGVFGLTAYAVTQRTKEIGVRIALGADGPRVLRTIVGSQVTPIALGVGLGILGSWWATRVLTTYLFGVRPTDPVTFAAVAVIITVVGLIACYIPARRVLRLDPVAALRAE
jgi:putative ABC transport system permease protein